ncbi:MAG: hypothetical protein KF819_21200 [Labilithrix sp.]|nr:hypothetical protein [Labilithrix sp.]
MYRGVNAFCTACGAPRMPLASTSVTLAGQGSKVGGTVARVFGWVVLAVGTLLSLGVWAACNAIAPESAAPYVLGVPMALISWVVSYFLLKGGRHLKESGVETEKQTRSQAVFALANLRGGMITPADLAQAIAVPPVDADAILTNLAKEHPDHVNIEVDDNGVIFYRFNQAAWHAIASNPANWERPRAQMAPNAPVQGARVAAGAAHNVRVDDVEGREKQREREAIEDEFASEPDVAERQAR